MTASSKSNGVNGVNGNAAVHIPKTAKATLEREKLFIKRYLVDLNATAAVLECGGYNCSNRKSADQMAAQLMKRPRVQLAIRAALDARAKKFDIQADDVLAELKKIGFSNMLDYARPTPDGSDLVMDVSQLTRDQAAAIQEVTSEIYTDGMSSGGDGEEKRPIHVKRTRLKLYDKRGPLELLGKHTGAFIDPPVPPSRLNVRIRVIYEDRKRAMGADLELNG